MHDVDAPDGAPDRVAGWVVLAVGSSALVALAVATGRHLWFYSDDWNILAGYHDGGLLEPFNGHLSLLPVLAFRAVAEVFGLGSYQPFRVVGGAAYLFLGVTVLVYARRRVGAVPGALAALLVMANASAVTNVAFPFLLNFSLPLAAMVWMWWFLDRGARRDDVAASASLGVGLASSGIGLLAMVAAGVELLWTRAPLRRWLVMSPPVALYVAWYAGFHAPVARGDGGPRAVLAYAGRMVLGGCASLVGNSRPGGVVVALGFGALLVLGVRRWHTFDGRVAGGLAAIAVFSLLTAWTRIGIVPRIPPDEPRYCWTIGAVIVLTAVHLLRDVQLRSRTAAAGAVAVGALVLLNTAVLAGRLAGWDRQVRDAVAGVRTNLWAAETAGRRLDPDRILPLSFIAVTGRDYLDMVDHLGSPVDGFDPRRASGNPQQRDTADRLLVEDLGVTLTGAAPGVTCTTAPGDRRPLEVRPGSTTVLCGGPTGATVRVARVGGGTEVGRIAPGAAGVLRLPRDGVALPWRVLASRTPGA